MWFRSVIDSNHLLVKCQEIQHSLSLSHVPAASQPRWPITVLYPEHTHTHSDKRGPRSCWGARRAAAAHTSVRHWGTWEGGWVPEGNISFSSLCRARLACWGLLSVTTLCCLTFSLLCILWTQGCVRGISGLLLYLRTLSGCTIDLAWLWLKLREHCDVTFYSRCGILGLGCVFATEMCCVTLAGSAGRACF